MRVEHKVAYWDAGAGGTSPEDLELRLDQLGREGWSAVAATAAADGGYLVVLTRSAEGVAVVELAAIRKIRRVVTRLVGKATGALPTSGGPPAISGR